MPSMTLFILTSIISVAWSIPLTLRTPNWTSPFHLESIQQLQASQPLNGLPSNSNATLVHVALGVGTQNYTCNGTTYVQSLAGSGAKANFYDVTTILRAEHASTSSLETYTQRVCPAGSCANSPPQGAPYIGYHYFSAEHVPIFNLTAARVDPGILAGLKVGSEPGATSSDVAWLFLTDADPSISKNFVEVYRVDTSGGEPESLGCETEGEEVQVGYSALYWVFE